MAITQKFSYPQVLSESKEQEEKRMEWFKNDKFGIFIYSGIYAVRGVFER